MPQRKEPKETVVYPSSKRPTPAFKPLRPSKVPRTATTESESSVKSKTSAKRAIGSVTEVPKPSKRTTTPDSDDEVNDAAAMGVEDSEDDSLGDDVPQPKPKNATARPTKPASARRKTSTRDPSPMSISPSHHNDPPYFLGGATAPMPTQSDDIPSIPQPLLLRLLHESFADKNTKIDTHAVQVLQKYVEIFVREAIAQTKFQKDKAVARGEVGEMEKGWLELEDLEKAAPALLLDF